jgi:hypothetical protein
VAYSTLSGAGMCQSATKNIMAPEYKGAIVVGPAITLCVKTFLGQSSYWAVKSQLAFHIALLLDCTIGSAAIGTIATMLAFWAADKSIR